MVKIKVVGVVMDKIIIKGANQHNLRNVDLELPKNELIVFTGVSVHQEPERYRPEERPILQKESQVCESEASVETWGGSEWQRFPACRMQPFRSSMHRHQRMPVPY